MGNFNNAIERLWAYAFKRIFKRQYEDFVKNLNMVTDQYKKIGDYYDIMMDFQACKSLRDLKRAQKKHFGALGQMRNQMSGMLQNDNLKKYELHSEIQELNDNIKRI